MFFRLQAALYLPKIQRLQSVQWSAGIRICCVNWWTRHICTFSLSCRRFYYFTKYKLMLWHASELYSTYSCSHSIHAFSFKPWLIRYTYQKEDTNTNSTFHQSILWFFHSTLKTHVFQKSYIPQIERLPQREKGFIDSDYFSDFSCCAHCSLLFIFGFKCHLIFSSTSS